MTTKGPTCSAQGCRKTVFCKGLCKMHDGRMRRTGALELAPKRTAPPCSVPGCQRRHYSLGWCRVHYDRQRTSGAPTPWVPNKQRECEVEGCSKLRHTRTLCSMHTRRMAKYGSTDLPQRAPARYTTKAGYVMVKQPQHPNADRSGYVLEHKLVMSKEIGRPISKGETVHHKNGQRADNRLSNLELWASAHPSGQRVSDLLVFAREIIERYGDLPTAA